MEALSPAHLLLILVIIVIFFGGRRIPEVMRGLGEGIRSFREGMRGDEKPTEEKPAEEKPTTPTK
jgi:sec-independent protein translocase protein TatA